MDQLSGFAEKDMIEQITILDGIQESGEPANVPVLLDLYASQQLDTAVDEMVYHTLFALMAGQTAAIGAALQHPSDRVRLLAIRRAADAPDPLLLPLLREFLGSCSNAEMISETLRALAGFKDPVIIDTLLPYLEHDDDAVAAWAMHSLVASGDDRARAALQGLVSSKADTLAVSGLCDLKTAQALASVAKLNDTAAVNFLINYIHHPAASFRKVAMNALASMGELILPALENCLKNGDKDEKIMAANIIGWTGYKKGADILTTLLSMNSDLEANLRFAIYEALGRTPSIRSFTALADGLAEEADEMVLVAVVAGLNDLCNPGLVKTVIERLDKGDQQSKRVIETIVTCRAVKIFAGIYKEQGHADALVAAICNSGDVEAVNSFKGALQNMEKNDRVAADIELLQADGEALKARRLVVADDSKAMLFFYKGAVADLDIDLHTFPDGKDALAYFQSQEPGLKVDLLVTDMNMPGMDGIELTRALRQMPQWHGLPILMASTETEKDQQEHARQAGVDDFISKPFSRGDFIAKVNKITGTL